MGKRFDYFVVFAEMRTGSNFLEENLNEIPGLHCYGEAFNPHFVGHANKFDLLGIDMKKREADPVKLIDQMRVKTDGLPGFRFFHDHDPRILETTLRDPRCAKIILTRNPADSYVSRKIAAATGQWRLNDLKNAKTAKAQFERADFEQHLDALQQFQLLLLNALQTTGQTAFYIGYDDLNDLEVLNGLGSFLGVQHKVETTSNRTKVQNPASLETKVANFDEMQEALAQIDWFDLTRTPNFEPRRAPAVPSYVAAAKAPLLFQPIKAGPELRVQAWLAALDGVDLDGLQLGFTQKTLRQWKRKNPSHRSSTVIRHPVARLHAAFVTHFVNYGAETFWDMRETLRKTYDLAIPEGAPDHSYGVGQHRKAFLTFIKFVKGNLGGQTSLRVDASWASQTEVLHGLARVMVPDMVLRDDMLELGLEQLAAQVGLTSPGVIPHVDNAPVLLSEIYDEEIEEAVRAAYQKDYMMFGFRAFDPKR